MLSLHHTFSSILSPKSEGKKRKDSNPVQTLPSTTFALEKETWLRKERRKGNQSKKKEERERGRKYPAPCNNPEIRKKKGNEENEDGE
jgi:hypothetical protein